MANFDKIAPFFDNCLIQFFYRLAHRRCLNFIKSYVKNDDKILEIGCGTGNFLGRLKKQNESLKLFGLDESRAMVKIAQKKFADINFKEGGAENLPFTNNYFDSVVIIDAFYYFGDKKEVLLECSRVLKTTGFLFIFTPSIDQFLSKILFWLSKLSSLEKRSEHLYFEDLKLLIERAGFQIIKKKISSWPFLPPCKYWLIICKKLGEGV